MLPRLGLLEHGAEWVRKFELGLVGLDELADFLAGTACEVAVWVGYVGEEA